MQKTEEILGKTGETNWELHPAQPRLETVRCRAGTLLFGCSAVQFSMMKGCVDPREN